MSLQYSNLDDAFVPLAKEERPPRKKERPEKQPDVHTVPVQALPHAPPPPKKTLADEITILQPYISTIFVILVLGMLYDMKNTMNDIKQLLQHRFLNSQATL